MPLEPGPKLGSIALQALEPPSGLLGERRFRGQRIRGPVALQDRVRRGL